MTGIEPLAYAAARLFACGSWIAAGVHASRNFEKTAAGMAERGIPMARQVLPVVLLMEFGGAALVLADPGFSFACKACIGIGPAMAGSASTGSSFMAQIVDKNGGTVLAMREWFIMTIEHQNQHWGQLELIAKLIRSGE